MATAQSLFENQAPAQARELRLLSLRLHNFQGIKELTLEPNGQNLDIYGTNGTGKTTLFSAWTWLLWDKDALNRKDFDIKTLTPEGDALHGLEHEVEGTFSFGGRQITLRKVYAEKWVKTRGSAERQFSGHETAYYVDGVPVRKQDYEARVAQIADERTFRLLSDPAYFNEVLHWQDRRRILLDVCGDISDREVIASDPDLAPLAEILGKRSLEDHRKVLAAARTKINRELEQIPIRISEVERGLPDVEGLDTEAARRQLIAARNSRKATVEQLVQAEQGGGVARKQQRTSEISARRLEIETAYRRRAEDAWAARRRRAQEAELAVSAAERELQKHREAASDHEDRAGQLEGELLRLRQTFRQLSQEEFAHVEETACPTCGQPLPEEVVEGARAKAQEQWNVAHAERLGEMNRRGRELRARQDQANAAAEESRRKITAAEERLVDARRAARAAAAEAERPESDRAIDADQEYRRLGEERDALIAEIRRLQAGGEAQTAGLRAEVAELDRAIAASERVISQVEQHARGTERISELRADEKRLAAEFEDLERQLYLTEAFVRAKVRLLTDRINSRFEMARFRLFEVQINGALSECCETTCGGVPYNSGLNRGARTNVGLDILNVLSEHFGLTMPVFADNAVAIAELLPVRGQLIRLAVSPPDKILRIVKGAS